MRPSYFLLSGEHTSLAYSELRSVLKLFGHGDKVRLIDGRVAVADLPPSLHTAVCDRTAYTRASGILLSLHPYRGDEKPEITISVDALDEIVDRPTTFRAEAIKLNGAIANTMKLEATYAEVIMNTTTKLAVSLDNPSLVFQCIVTPKHLLAGVRLYQKPPRLFMWRRAGLRPFTTPTAIQPKLARCMVNLAVTSQDSTVYDPFAGSGSIVVEAALLGHMAVGTELKTWIANGMLKNLHLYVPGHEMVAQADARKPPFRMSIDSIVTDPPYGRSSTITGKSLSKLLTDLLSQVGTLLRRGGRICITLPSEPAETFEAEKWALKTLETHRIYVHKALTRYLSVFST